MQAHKRVTGTRYVYSSCRLSLSGNLQAWRAEELASAAWYRRYRRKVGACKRLMQASKWGAILANVGKTYT